MSFVSFVHRAAIQSLIAKILFIFLCHSLKIVRDFFLEGVDDICHRMNLLVKPSSAGVTKYPPGRKEMLCRLLLLGTRNIGRTNIYQLSVEMRLQPMRVLHVMKQQPAMLNINRAYQTSA